MQKRTLWRQHVRGFGAGARFGQLVAFDVLTLSEGLAVLAVRGDLNATAASALKARVKKLISEGWSEIVCDLTGVGVLDSAGLAALITSVRAARESGGFFRFVAVNERVAHMFRLTMLDRVFELHPSVEAALAPSEGAAGPARELKPAA